MEQFDVEFLQKLNYDRSRAWSSFFENYQNVAIHEDVENDIDITEIETTAVDGNVSDDFCSMEDDCVNDVDPEFLKNATNTTQFSLMIGNGPVDLSVMIKTEKEKEYADVINKTLPILTEHNRQLKKFGFDKVLISFNKKEIENKFGSWLNRHNSLFGGDNTLICDTKNNSSRKESSTCPAEKAVIEYDSDASLQSGETARYIRSSRVGTAKNTKTTMIKTYRMVRKTHEKYACETVEDDYHQNDVQIRKKFGNMEYQKQYQTPLTRSNRNERIAFTTRTHRRKVLRKRIHSSCCNADYSSSDSECYENDKKCQRQNLRCCCAKRRHCSAVTYSTPLIASNRNGKVLKARSAMKMSSAFRNRIYYFSRSMSTPSSSSSSSFSSFTKRRDIKRNVKFSNDESLYKRESQCSSYNDKKLFNQFRHVTDTSAEDRHVDSECTPKKQPKTPITETQIKKSQQLKSQAEKLQPIAEKKPSNVKVKQNLKENHCKSKNKQPVELFSSDSSGTELRKAIEASKLTYKEEERERLQKYSAKKDERIKPAKRPTRKLLEIEAGNTAIKTKKLAQNTESATKKPSTKQDLSNIQKINSFFAPTQTKTICNSTALSCKGQAYKRQFADKQVIMIDNDEEDSKSLEDETVIDLIQYNSKAKSTSRKLTSTKISKENGSSNFTVSSTTLRSPELSFSLSETIKSKPLQKTVKETGGEISDCADVTSTTVEKPKEDVTENGVLIYAPENRHKLAANSLTGDGYFTVTQEHLSSIIGEKTAKNFLKYYTGRTRFRLDSTVYYEPPRNSSLHHSSTSSDDLDFFDQLGKFIIIPK